MDVGGSRPFPETSLKGGHALVGPWATPWGHAVSLNFSTFHETRLPPRGCHCVRRGPPGPRSPPGPVSLAFVTITVYHRRQRQVHRRVEPDTRSPPHAHRVSGTKAPEWGPLATRGASGGSVTSVPEPRRHRQTRSSHTELRPSSGSSPRLPLSTPPVPMSDSLATLWGPRQQSGDPRVCNEDRRAQCMTCFLSGGLHGHNSDIRVPLCGRPPQENSRGSSAPVLLPWPLGSWREGEAGT